MKELYPLKFTPIYKEKIWGGNKLKTTFNRDYSPLANAGESWEISGVQSDTTIVSNGFLAGNDLNELIEIYMGELVGDGVFERFGEEFPLLIKFIDAMDNLSIQVHPDDKLSKKRHNAFGKTEMWYVMQADKGAELISGFGTKVDKSKYLTSLNEGKIETILNSEVVKPGDVYFIPAGRVHAIGKGIMLAEIQQTSDVTYRIYDYNRKGDDGKTRELHTDLAVDAIDYSHKEDYKSKYSEVPNQSSEIVDCEYFTTNVIKLDSPINIDYFQKDSFIIYIGIEGTTLIETKTGTETLNTGETILIPASINEVKITPNGESKILEVYIK